ncbi:organelle RRM domain-containing protein 6, chloroplastic isoform X3 [Musa acuminata AAA Group]|uniref:organelle RRM domain-containing protein 6, chloroplastic isoform X3 n=1 Tax=Musa acuminata AAA Group TaxID=214697 RepID=UPI0031D90CC2
MALGRDLAAEERRLLGVLLPPSDPLHQALCLSFRTTEESLRNAFQNFGQLVEVNLVMDRIANRPRGFAFLRYATEEESKKAIEGMHGKVNPGSRGDHERELKVEKKMSQRTSHRLQILRPLPNLHRRLRPRIYFASSSALSAAPRW